MRNHRLQWVKYDTQRGIYGKDDLISKIYPVYMWELSKEEEELVLSHPDQWVRIIQ